VADAAAAAWADSTSETFSSVDFSNRRKGRQIRDSAEILVGPRGIGSGYSVHLNLPVII